MDQVHYSFIVRAEDQAAAGRGAEALVMNLREAEGVLEADRRKADDSTMDLGAIVTVLASSAATLAVAQGIAAWLRARRGTKLTIDIDGGTGGLKVAVHSIDPEVAERITETVLKASGARSA